jgi:hypothetical protein
MTILAPKVADAGLKSETLVQAVAVRPSLTACLTDKLTFLFMSALALMIVFLLHLYTVAIPAPRFFLAVPYVQLAATVTLESTANEKRPLMLVKLLVKLRPKNILSAAIATEAANDGEAPFLLSADKPNLMLSTPLETVAP